MALCDHAATVPVSQTTTQRVAILLGFLFVVMLLATVRVGTARYSSTPDDEPVSRIDPNTAPWWELTALPGVGPVTARAIVDHRKAVRDRAGDPAAIVFTRPADLEAVHGIGPKTVAKIAAYLRFDGSRAGPNR